MDQRCARHHANDEKLDEIKWSYLMPRNQPKDLIDELQEQRTTKNPDFAKLLSRAIKARRLTRIRNLLSKRAK
jgi:hypothetical protein